MTAGAANHLPTHEWYLVPKVIINKYSYSYADLHKWYLVLSVGFIVDPSTAGSGRAAATVCVQQPCA